MKHYLRKLIIVVISLYIAYSLVPTVKLGDDLKNIPIVIAAFFFVAVLIKPFFSLVLLPINFMTTNLVSLALNVAVLFGLINFIPGVAVDAYNFPGASFGGISLQAISLNQIATILVLALIVTIVQKALHLLFD